MISAELPVDPLAFQWHPEVWLLVGAVLGAYVYMVRVIGPSAEQKKITLRTELSSLYLGVHVDEDMFSQAVINLLSNAVKYTPEGGTITLRSRLKDEQVQVEVAEPRGRGALGVSLGGGRHRRWRS